MGKPLQSPLSISIRPAKSADLPLLSRLDIAANATHPLISQSFTYPFQALKLFLAHLEFCFKRSREEGQDGEYRFLVARLRSGVRGEGESDLSVSSENLSKGVSLKGDGGEGSDADSGVDVSIVGDEQGMDGDLDGDDGSGEIFGFVMWRETQMRREDGTRQGEEWDWLSHLPPGTNTRLWKRYAEVMSSNPEIGSDGGIGKS